MGVSVRKIGRIMKKLREDGIITRIGSDWEGLLEDRSIGLSCSPVRGGWKIKDGKYRSGCACLLRCGPLFISASNEPDLHAFDEVPCLHEHLATACPALSGNAARVKYPTALQRRKLDTPLLAVGYLIYAQVSAQVRRRPFRSVIFGMITGDRSCYCRYMEYLLRKIRRYPCNM